MRQSVSSSATCAALILSGLLPLTLACDATIPVDLPSAAVPLTAPGRFALWWRITEACSGTTGDFRAVSWYVVPNTSTFNYQGREVNAYWLGNPDRIVLADEHRNYGPTVRHEMLHALLHRPGHARADFLTACGGVVACSGTCSTETGEYGSPTASASELQPREVGTRVQVMSPLPGQVLDSAVAAVLVTITNPRSEPVWVKLAPLESGALVYQTFGIIVDYDDPAKILALSAEATTSDLYPLGAGESRRWVWDGILGQGRFGFRGFFNVDSTARQVIQVGP